MVSPKIRRQERGGKSKRVGLWIAGGLVLVCAALAGFFLLGPVSFLQASTAKAADESTDLKTAAVRRGDIRISITGSGTLVAGQSVDLAFPVEGSLAEVNVSAGEAVTAGQVIARLENSSNLQSAQANAELAYLQASQALKDLQQNADVSLAQAYQEWANAKAAYEEALDQQQRSESFRCSQAVNTRYAAALERATQNLNSKPTGSDEWIEAKNNYDSALANYNYCIAYTGDEKSEAQANLAVAEAALNQAAHTYDTLKAAAGVDPDELALAEAKEKQAGAALDLANRNLEGIVITAPIDGVITYLGGSAGEMAGTDTFVTISDLSQPCVEIQVDETDLENFTTGSTVEVLFDALPDRVLTGKVEQVDPALSSSFQTTTAAGFVRLNPDAADILKGYPLGLSATVEVIRSEAADTLIIPVEALRDLGGGEYAVFVVGEDGALRLKTVEVGLQDTTWAEIKQGLLEGDVVSTGKVDTNS